MPPPWNDWYHCTASTYGTWLRGDPRGWRARHHREHVDGDYKNPPPKGKYDRLHELSTRLMKRDPVHIERELRGIVVEEFALRLWQEGSDVVVGSFDDHHLHVLLRARKHARVTSSAWQSGTRRTSCDSSGSVWSPEASGQSGPRRSRSTIGRTSSM